MLKTSTSWYEQETFMTPASQRPGLTLLSGRAAVSRVAEEARSRPSLDWQVLGERSGTWPRQDCWKFQTSLGYSEFNTKQDYLAKPPLKTAQQSPQEEVLCLKVPSSESRTEACGISVAAMTWHYDPHPVVWPRHFCVRPGWLYGPYSYHLLGLSEAKLESLVLYLCLLLFWRLGFATYLQIRMACNGKCGRYFPCHTACIINIHTLFQSRPRKDGSLDWSSKTSL